MTFHLNEREIKDKWLKKYQEEIEIHKENLEKEKQSKIKEEQDYLTRIKKEMEEEKIKKHDKKKQIIQSEMEDYLTHNLRKKEENEKNYEEKRNPENVSLNLGYEERIKKMKEYNNKLADKVDLNMELFKNYDSNHRSNLSNLENHASHQNGNFKANLNQEILNYQTNNIERSKDRNDIYRDNNYYSSPNSKILDKDYYKYLEYKEV